jgi:tRNA(Ile)-lysidine synthase
MIDRMQQVLQHQCRLTPNRLVLVGVSGGADSLCLLHLLWKLGYPVAVAHLDHNLRPDSAADARSVQELAGAMQLPFYLGREDVAAYADRHMLSVEEAARLIRYRFLFDQAARCQAQAVAVGHTADDQVETILMHLLRGSGLSGLAGMAAYSLPNAWSREIPLVRPLLVAWRNEIEQYVGTAGLQPVEDATNREPRFYRNRLRHELIPTLEQYNPNLRRLIWQMAEILTEDEKNLLHWTEEAWQACLVRHGDNWLALDAFRIAGASLSLQRRLVRQAVQRLRPGLRDVDYAAVERAIAVIQGSSGEQCDLVGGLRLLREGNLIWVAAWEAEIPLAQWAGQDWPQLPAGQEIPLPVPGEFELPGGWRLISRISAATSEALASALANHDPYQVDLDAETLQSSANPLQLRSRRPGDRFQPLGLGGHSMKISDFFINSKLPRRARLQWPLLVCGETIAWVPGLRPSHEFRIRQGTYLLLHFQLVRD